MTPRDHLLTAQRVLEAVAPICRTTPMEILGTRRSRHVSYARMVSCWLLRELTGASLPATAELLGDLNHTTVIHACRRVAADLETNGPLGQIAREALEALTHQRPRTHAA